VVASAEIDLVEGIETLEFANSVCIDVVLFITMGPSGLLGAGDTSTVTTKAVTSGTRGL